VTGSQYLAKFNSVRSLVIGDLMLDEYIFGRATRVSQEAPVLVVKHQRTSSVPGGAANVAMNLMALGASTGVIGAIGADPAGDDLIGSLMISGIDPIDILRDPSRPTTRKTRVVANHSHQVLRIDIEEEAPLVADLQAKVLEKCQNHAQGRDIILLSDYQKGAIPGPVIEAVVKLGKTMNIPVVANAKPGTVGAYRGASVVSLNRFEASSAMGYLTPITDEMAADTAMALREKFEIDSLVVTLGGSGMVSASASGVAQAPAVKVEVYDEAGAGDTVIATLALCAAFGPIDEHSLRLATHTAASVVRKVGVAVPTAEDLEQISRTLG
jgi:rfaE bifunctional protein kinase chain/domain